jgi:hypothetical protein
MQERVEHSWRVKKAFDTYVRYGVGMWNVVNLRWFANIKYQIASRRLGV